MELFANSFGRARRSSWAGRAYPYARTQWAATWRPSGYTAQGRRAGKWCRARRRRGCRLR
eukprot:4338996-Pleurochrysis_carterae.AAC.1